MLTVSFHGEFVSDYISAQFHVETMIDQSAQFH